MVMIDSQEEFAFATNFRLSLRHWLAVLVILFVILGATTYGWSRIEKIPFGKDFRIPAKLKGDYWLFSKWSEYAVKHSSVLIMGDSVPWGQFVKSKQTLASCFTQQNHQKVSFANLGIGGVHPVALVGLLKYHGAAIHNTKVLLYWNLVWMRSDKMDLRQKKEFANLNHPRLLSQTDFSITCYQADFETRCTRWLDQHSSLTSLINHLRMNYYGNNDLQSWMLEHPYRCPFSVINFKVDAPFLANPHAKDIERARQAAPDDQRNPLNWQRRLVDGRGYRLKDFPWVAPKDSRQWTAFLQSVKLLKQRGNQVFVLIGPLNANMLKSRENRELYASIRTKADKILTRQQVGHILVPALASDLFADLSHPLAKGYSLIARQALKNKSFQQWLSKDLGKNH